MLKVTVQVQVDDPQQAAFYLARASSMVEELAGMTLPAGVILGDVQGFIFDESVAGRRDQVGHIRVEVVERG